jgi:hypothetical protein
MQETGKLFGMVDEGERDRIRREPGLRAVVEVLKSRVSVRPSVEILLMVVACWEMDCDRDCEYRDLVT